MSDEERTMSRGEGSAAQDESGSWGTAALLILSVLFVIAAAATLHSVLATLL